ncbi:RloB domain-containing protein [Puniceicoccus vermicola]|uniref:RloB domain-containing protein n=1 Tax=Puniceicoccus vermicola TaxID=388746 RepID=A0A7X1AV17_9BACT|nr:RloB domain-containing protein [Puniceicoccus vermicola]MBC2600536.1 RloB domain-containing protein [Puniceicoccus vermicola]
MSRSNPFNQKTRQIQHTTLIVVEGDTELALVKYLRALCGRNCGTRVSPENAHGGSGDVVLEMAIKLGKDFDARACIYDMDRAPKLKKHIRKAKQLGIHEIKSTPCIEALLLEILGEKVPASTDDCKRAMQRILGEDSLTEIPTFEKYFPKELIERRKSEVPQLDVLMGLINRNSKK